MPGIVGYCMGSPFKRVPRVEFTYASSSIEALDPVAALLDPEVFDNVGVVFVPDIYSVWPQVGLFPHVESYREVLDGLAEFARRECPIRMSPRICGRIVGFYSVPWSGVMGSWRFTGSPGDALVFVLLGLLKAIDLLHGRAPAIYAVVGEDAHPALSKVLEVAVLAATVLASTEARVVYAEPRPYPPERTAESRLHDAYSISWPDAARLLAAHSPSIPNKVLEPATPRASVFAERLSKLTQDVVYTLASLAFYNESMLLPLLYSGCVLADKAEKPLALLEQLARIYIDSTELHKKPVGGNVVHHLRFSFKSAIAITAGLAVEAAAYRALTAVGADCEKIRGEGVPERVLERIAKLLGVKMDRTPSGCVENVNGRVRLAGSCLKKLRQELVPRRLWSRIM